MSEVVHELFDDVADYEELLEDAETAAVTDWEMQFVADMKQRFEDYGSNAYLSLKQLDSLRKISGD